MCTQYLLEYFQNSQYSVLTRVLFLSTRFIPGRDTLVSLELKVDYTADRFNSLALTGITADTLIALRRGRFIYLQEHYCLGIRRLFTLKTY